MKKLLFLFSIFVLSLSLYATSFSYWYEGSSTITVPFGSSTVSRLVHFNYDITESLHRAKLIIAVDGDLVTNDLCTGTGTYLPSSFTLHLSEGVHDVHFSLLSIDPDFLSCYIPIIHKEYNETFTVKFQVRVQNNFPGGDIYVGDMVTPKNAPYNKTASNGVTIPVKAKEQFADNYQRIWNQNGTNNSNWEYKRTGDIFRFLNDNIQTSYNVQSNDKNTEVQANLRKQCNISLSNQFSGTSMSGQMYINNNDDPADWFNVPKTETIVEQNPIVFGAENYYDENNIRYIFDKWDDNITSQSRTIYPSSHETYTAIYKGYPIFEDPMRGLVISGVREGKTYYIKLDWNEHPNSYVTQYHIYRYTKFGSQTTTPVKIATKSRGTTTFTDYAFTYAPTTGEYQVL